ncbi:MAG TPA: bacteriohopanetetrol glucosamine biosynthesis glycosyltransferase HpnI [Candidatus Acidoferrales bacterium]
MRTAIVLAIVIFSGTIGDILVSRTMKRIGEVKDFSPRALFRVGIQVVRSPLFWSGILLAAIAFFSFLALLSWAPVSFVVPATALGYVVGTVAARFVLGEMVGLTRWVGVVLLCVGVAVASFSGVGRELAPHSVFRTLRWIVLTLACAPFFYYFLGIYSARKFFLRQRRRGPYPMDFTPPISILKPVRGTDRGAYDNYASFCRLDYPEYEMVFVVQDDEDPAIPVIQKVMADFPRTKIRMLVGAEDLGYSNKVCKMVRLVREARYDLFVLSDSDVRVEPDYLRMVVENFKDPAVGAVTSVFRGIEEGNFGSQLDCLGASIEFCGGALVANQLEGVLFAHGATMAARKETLARIGGFEALVNNHSDDFEFGNRIAKLGYRVEIARKPVNMVSGPEGLGEYLRHELRWAIGLRHVRPGGHAGLLFTQGLPWAILAGLIAPTRTIAAAFLLAYIVIRFLHVWTIGVWGLNDRIVRKKFWLMPVRDFFAFPVWVCSFFTNRIQWRGAQFTIRKGILIPVQPPPARG